MAWGTKCDVCKEKYRHYHRPGDPRPLPSVTEILGVIAKPALTGWAFKMARLTALAAARAAYAATHFEVASPGPRNNVGALPSSTFACLALSPHSFMAIVEKTAPSSQWKLPKTEADIGTLVHARIESEIRVELGQNVPIVPVPESDVVDGRKVPHPAWNAYQAYLAWRSSHRVKIVSIEQRVYSMKLGFAGTSDIVCYIDDKLTVGDFKTSKAVYPEYLLQVAAYRAAVIEMEGKENPDMKNLGGVILRFPKGADDTFEVVDVPWKDQKSLMAAFMNALGLWRWQQEES